MLKLENITKTYGDTQVLHGISLTLANGDSLSLSGMSGSGKTTLLRLIAGLEKPDSGKVISDSRIAVVFAEPRLFPSIDVMHNITAVMHGDKKKNEDKARKILASLGLEGADALYPEELSSGMAARVAIARAVAYDAELYLLDEPFKTLDTEVKQLVMAYLSAFFKGKSVIMISHDESEISYMGFPSYRLSNGELIRKDENSN